ncbi:PaaX family transcriptional regulator [Amycolatopsis jejuensis]|uniref:PaaX family transcriptional regulator n=1 Tax=Amycolatopsis jejuensis TaxID=330084 RepID=UPI0006919FE5|nr:PaaX family transcriptional regulator C-terminal domain-containing protein [Amycolatopsis jejuensis]
MTDVTNLSHGDGARRDTPPIDWLTPSTPQNSLITDLCLLYVLDRGGWLPTAAYVSLLGDLDVVPSSARTGLHRLSRGGFVESRREGKANGYAVTRQWEEFMRMRYPELFHAANDTDPVSWTLVSFSIPESRRADRHLLRKTLTRLGFGSLAPGLWIAPSDGTRVNRLVDQLGVADEVDLFTANYIGDSDLAARCWDLPALEAQYREFLTDLDESTTGTKPLTPREAFARLTLVHNKWRLIVQGDPRLPASVLPRGWVGHRVRDRVTDLIAELKEPAGHHVLSVLDDRPATAGRKKGDAS